MPVPAGPMPNTIVCAVDRVDVALLVQRLRPDRAAAAGQDVQASAPRPAARRCRCPSIADAAPTASAVEVSPRSSSSISSSNSRAARAFSAGSPVIVISLPRTWMSLVERLLDDPQQLVARAEQAHHGVGAGHDDLGLGGGLAVRHVVGPRAGTRLPSVPESDATESAGRPADRPRPPRTCACAWKTVWPASRPVLKTMREPAAGDLLVLGHGGRLQTGPSAARSGPRPQRRHGGVVRLRDDQHVGRGLRVDVAEGQRASSSRTTFAGTPPATILQNRQSAAIRQHPRRSRALGRHDRRVPGIVGMVRGPHRRRPHPTLPPTLKIPTGPIGA